MSTALLLNVVRTAAFGASIGAHVVGFAYLSRTGSGVADVVAAPAPTLIDVDLAPEAPVADAVQPVIDEAPEQATKVSVRSTHAPDAPAGPRVASAPAGEGTSTAPSPTPAATSADDAPVHFSAPAGTTVATTLGAPAGTATGAANGAGGTDENETFAAGAVDAPAHLVAAATAVYPPSARAEQIECDVPVDIVVDTHGSVISARAGSHAGFGLDEAAVTAMRSYRFSPASRGGHPVRVRMRWTVQFRLR